jgi:hypothetical protein
MIFRESESESEVEDGSRNVRDNNAAWVAGPSRICLLGASAF